MTRVTMGAVLATAVFCHSGDSLAQPGPTPFPLEWSAPSNCPQLPEVSEQLRTLSGAPEGSTLPSHLRAEGAISLVGERYQLTLSIRAGATKGTRVIVADDCGNLGKAAAVVLGLLIRKERTLGRELSTAEIGGDWVSPPQPRDTPQTPDEPTTRPWPLRIWAPTLAIDFLTLPKVGYGVGLAAGVHYETSRVILAGTLWPSQTTTTAVYQARFSRKTVELWGGYGWRWDSFEVSPCALVALDVVGVSASGDRLRSRPQNTVWASMGGGFAGFWHLSENFSLFVLGSTRIAIRRPEFVVEGMVGTTQAHTVPMTALVLSTGSEWFF